MALSQPIHRAVGAASAWARLCLVGALVAVFGFAAPAWAERPTDGHAAVTGGLPWRLSLALEYSPLERDLFERHAAQSLKSSDLQFAALVASGVKNDTELAAWRQRWHEIVSRLRGGLPQACDGEELAQAVYRFMHQELLHRGYDIQCSDMTAALETGRFNCISATLLYNCLAAEVGLAARAAEAPGHVFSLVELEQGRLEVETTCPGWFEILHDPQRLAAFAPPVAGAEPSPGGRGAIQRVLGTAELAAIVYYNRGVDCVERRDYPAAIACNQKALQLDRHNAVARGNLLAAINNWALEEAEQARYGEALELIRCGRRIAPEHATFTVNFVALHQQWADALCAAERFGEAATALQKAAREAPDQPQFDATRFLIYRRWGERLAAAGQYDEMFTLFADGRRREPGRAVQWSQAEVVAVRNVALHLAQTGRPKTAVWLLDQAMNRHPHNAALGAARHEILQQRSAA